MKIFVTVKPRSKMDCIEEVDDTHFIVRLCARPIEGQANEALIRILASHFQVSQSRISIVSGARSRKKTIEIR